MLCITFTATCQYAPSRGVLQKSDKKCCVLLFFCITEGRQKCCVLHLQVPYTTFTLQNLGGKRLHDIYITKFGEKTSGAGAGQKYSGQTYSSSHFPE